MKIFLLRHATAELQRTNLADRDRRLTKAGIGELQKVVRAMRRLKVRPDEILASPYRRAWETAEIATRGLAPSKTPIEMRALIPSGDALRVWQELKKHHAAKALLLVGHEPLLSEFAAFLLNSPQLSINFKKAGLIRIDVHTMHLDRPAGTLRWVLTARQMIKMIR
jgi:phosphohistidine phosphatase